jgi:hypothetical protein
LAVPTPRDSFNFPENILWPVNAIPATTHGVLTKANAQIAGHLPPLVSSRLPFVLNLVFQMIVMN